MRRCGTVVPRRRRSSPAPGLPAEPANRPVGTSPGATALTRTPCGPPYIAAPRMTPSTPCLDDSYGSRSWLPRRLAIDAVRTIAPPAPCAAYWRKAARTPRKAPRRLTEHDPVEVLDGDLGQPVEGADDAGVEVVQVHPAEPLDGGGDVGVGVVRVGDVGADGERGPGSSSATLRGPVEFDVHHDDRRALARQQPRGGRADAGGGSGDDGDRAVESAGHDFLSGDVHPW